MPPAMEARCTSGLIASYTKSKLSGASGEPVDVIIRTDDSLCVSRGRRPAFLTESIHLAEVPKTSICASSA